MKNIIFLLVDCFDYNKIGANEYRESPTPFLDQLKHNSYWAEKMYSQAPFTESALIATMCGYDTLDRGGYLKRYKNCPKNMFEMIQEAGWEVYAQMWPHFYPSSSLKGIDVLQLRPFSFEVLWSYRFDYYAKLYDNGELEDQDIVDLIDILNDNLDFWKQYYEMILGGKEEVKIVTENMDVSKVPACYEVLKKEIIKFHENQQEYIYGILKAKREHILFSLFNEECLDQKIPAEFREKNAKKYVKLNQKIYKTNNKLNRKNNHLSIHRLKEYYKRSKQPWNLKERTIFSQYLRNYYHITHYNELLGAIGEHYDRRKDWLSTHRMMEYFLDWEEQRVNKDKPYFAYMHTEDIHGQCTVFDICCTDETELERQMKETERYIDMLPRNYKGNLGYDLGLMNLDRTIAWFYKTLEKKGILEDTILVITSDHGCGTNYNPLRGEIQNFHDECYHVPFIICGADIEDCIDQDMHMTKDIMATIADLLGSRVPESSTGISIFSDQKRKWINQEYMGPGCPDMYRRPIWMCAFDEKWKVFIKVNLMQNTFRYSLEEVYDLENDPVEINNLALSKRVYKDPLYLIDMLEKRWNAIKNGYSRSDEYES